MDGHATALGYDLAASVVTRPILDAARRLHAFQLNPQVPLIHAPSKPRGDGVIVSEPVFRPTSTHAPPDGLIGFFQAIFRLEILLGEVRSAQATAADPALDFAFIDDSEFTDRLNLPFGWRDGRPYVHEEYPDAAGLDQRGSLPLIYQNPTPMRLAALRTFALSLPHTTFVKQWGECLVFKVAGKMFLIIALDADLADSVVFKCDPADFDALTEIDGVTQAPYCAKRMWAKVGDLAALRAPELERHIRRSYDLVVAGLPKKTLLALAFPV